MENASKAIIMAGGVLVMILILTFAVYMFSRVGNNTAEFYDEISEADITAFNQQFFNYEQKEYITAQDVVSIINLAKDANNKRKTPVVIKVDGSNEWLNIDEIGFLKSEINSKFTCVVKYGNNTNYVETITIKKITS